MNSIHFQKILKRTVTRLWDTLSDRDRDLIASDVDRETNLAKWFDTTVAAEAKAKYESPTYWLNDPYSFKTANYAN
jgi:hypothetical protein